MYLSKMQFFTVCQKFYFWHLYHLEFLGFNCGYTEVMFSDLTDYQEKKILRLIFIQNWPPTKSRTLTSRTYWTNAGFIPFLSFTVTMSIIIYSPNFLLSILKRQFNFILDYFFKFLEESEVERICVRRAYRTNDGLIFVTSLY